MIFVLIFVAIWAHTVWWSDGFLLCNNVLPRWVRIVRGNPTRNRIKLTMIEETSVHRLSQYVSNLFQDNNREFHVILVIIEKLCAGFLQVFPLLVICMCMAHKRETITFSTTHHQTMWCLCLVKLASKRKL